MWKCRYASVTCDWSGARLRLGGFFDGAGDLRGNLENTLKDRIRRPDKWNGVGVLVITPLGQRAEFFIDTDNGNFKVQEVKP